jgi:hypothetical protein
MLTTPKSISSNQYPEFIRNSLVLKDLDKKKIFPEIGLKNCKYSFSIKNVQGTYEAGISFLKDLRLLINSNIATMDHSFDSSVMAAVSFLKKICNLIKKNPESFLSDKEVNLVLPKDMEFINNKFLEGTNLFHVISTIRGFVYGRRVGGDGPDFLADTYNLGLDYYNSFLAFQKENLKIVFSGSGEKCNWDIATMSMRGIDSCQRWGNHHAGALVGSIADPYAGIIYIESDEDTLYGKRMIKRAVVRFILNSKTKDPAIMIERIYPFDYDGRVPDYLAFTVFSNFIMKKTKYKYDVIYGQDSCAKKFFIPKSKSLNYLLDGQLSYRDSKIPYKKIYRTSLKNKSVNKLIFNKV